MKSPVIKQHSWLVDMAVGRCGGRGEGQGNKGWGEADQEPETRADMPLDSTFSLRNSEFPFLAPIAPKVHIHTYGMS